MTTKKAIYKVPNGKLLKIFLEVNEGVIQSIKITGDFFAYPEESIEKLEKVLTGVTLNEALLRTKISDFLKDENVVFYGLDVDSLILTILTCSAS